MVDFSKVMIDYLLQISIKKLPEKMALHEHHIAFVNTHICYNVIPREFQLKFCFNISDLNIAKILRNCSKMLMFKNNSNIKRILTVMA